MRRQPEQPTPAAPSGYLMLAAVLLLAAPLSLPAWAAGSYALRQGARRWVLALTGLVPGVAAAGLLGPALARHGLTTVLGIVGAPGALRPSTALLGAVVGTFLRWAVLTAPLGIPAGLLVAAVPIREPAVPRPEWQADRRRAEQREQARQRKRAVKHADREGADLRSNALGVSLGGSVEDWRIGDLVVPPPRQLGYAMLLMGAPGTGKTTATERLSYLCGGERRHLVVIDAKGGHDGLAEGVTAAFLAAWPDARVRLFPQERLDIWRGDAQAIVNRLLQVWDWSLESQWYAEVAVTALRLALGQRGPACRSGEELVARLDPGRLQRAWEHDPLILGLVRNMASDLPGVQVRVGNLMAALQGALDGSASWEDADCWVVTVPAMVASRDADSALRIMLSDYAHFTMARKPRGQPSHLIVDEFAAIAGGRRVAIDLLERGRGAGAGVTLSGQSAAALGNEEERARLMAAASAVLLFRTPQPAELAALAGSERIAEGAWQVDGEDLTGRSTITMRARARVDQDRVRQLPTGEADLIVRGQVERIRVIRTAIPAAAATQAQQLVATRGAPAQAVATRPVPTPPARPRVRQHRPPPASGSRPARRHEPKELEP